MFRLTFTGRNMVLLNILSPLFVMYGACRSAGSRVIEASKQQVYNQDEDEHWKEKVETLFFCFHPQYEVQ